jgi:iron complex outermembrane receptor protein
MNHPGIHPFFFLFVALFSWFEPGFSQVPDSTRADTVATPVYRLEGLTIVVPRPVSTTGGASAVEVTLDSMMTRPAPTLEQVLREMPLIQIRRNSRGEAQPALRGGEDRQIAVIMDGVPLTLGWDARTDLSIIPLTSAQRVNLIRGLSSVLFGPNVLGGVIEVDVARGADRQQAPRPFQASLGFDQTGARSLSAAAGRLFEGSSGTWVLRVGGGHQARDGLVLPGDALEETDLDPALLTADGDLLLNTDRERYDGFLSTRFLSGSGSWLSLTTSAFKEERGVAPEAHVAEPRLWRYPEQSRWISAFSAGTGQRPTALGEGDLEISLGVDVGSSSIDQFGSSAYDDVVGGEEADDRTVTVRVMGDHSVGGSGEVRAAFTYADVHHEEVLDGTDANTYRQRLWSLAGEGEWRLGVEEGPFGTRGTRVSLGLVADGADTPESGDKPPLESLLDWGGRFGFTTLAGVDGLLFHGSVSRRTRFPALRELYSGALGRFLPNPDLRPEVLTGGEMGFTFTRPRAEIQAVGFHQVLSDGIVRSTVTTPEGKKYRRVNQDRIRSTGFELLASGALGSFGWSGDLTVQRVRGVDEGGNEVELEYEPSIAGKFSAFLPLPAQVQATASARFMGQQYCQNPDLGGLDSVDGSRHLDLGLRRVFGSGSESSRRTEVAVSLANATDAVVLDQCGIPQPGRTLALQIRIW